MVIKNDDSSAYFPLPYSPLTSDLPETRFWVDATNVKLYRLGGGFFDTNEYDDVGGVQGSRGRIIIWYKV